MQFDPRALAMVQRLEGMNMLHGDQALDEARRLSWMLIFSGASPARIQGEVGASDVAIKIAIGFAGMTIDDIERLIFETRLLLWSQNFARVPNSPFARQLEKTLEAQPSDSHNAKLH